MDLREAAHARYEEMFELEDKAAAFDKIAELYYYTNFGSASKTDIDTLMFSLYIERILEKQQSDINAYSDYALSKQLGITQAKVSNLKVRKELLYPYRGFDWRKSFLRVASRAVYEDGKIKVFVPDKNLFLEIKNAIESFGGFIEIQLTSNLLQVRLEYFLDLILAVSNDEERAAWCKKIKEHSSQQDNDVELYYRQTFKERVKNAAKEDILNILGCFLSPISGTAKEIAKELMNAVERELSKKK